MSNYVGWRRIFLYNLGCIQRCLHMRCNCCNCSAHNQEKRKNLFLRLTLSDVPISSSEKAFNGGKIIHCVHHSLYSHCCALTKYMWKQIGTNWKAKERYEPYVQFVFSVCLTSNFGSECEILRCHKERKQLADIVQGFRSKPSKCKGYPARMHECTLQLRRLSSSL